MIIFFLYGPGDATCSRAIATSTAFVNGDGEYGSAASTPTTRGTYQWVAYYEDDGTPAGASVSTPYPCANLAQAIYFPAIAPLVGPTAEVSITDSAPASTHPTGLVDYRVDVTNAGPDTASDVTVTVPVPAGAALDLEPGSSTCATVQGPPPSVVCHLGSMAAGGSAELSIVEIATTLGTLTNTASVNAAEPDPNPDNNVATATTDVVMGSPTLSTSASGEVDLYGGPVTDTATIAGGRGPTGSLTFNLYGPSNTPSCAGTPVFTSTVGAVSGNRSYDSAGFTPTQAGTYYWTASYSGDPDNYPASEACGAANESVHVEGAAEQLNDLLGATNAIGPGNSVAAAVQTAIGQLNAGNTSGACSTLAGLVGEAQAQSGHHLTVEQANEIIADANRILRAIGCGSAAVQLSVTVGPPTTQFTVTGTGFGRNETVTISFDGVTSVTSSNGAGSFVSSPITVPPDATPGAYPVFATGASSDGAVSSFLVRTDWASYRFSSSRAGMNPYENVLSASSLLAHGLTQAWSATTAGRPLQPPAVANGVVYVGSDGGALTAVDAVDGHRLWQVFTGDGSAFDSSPAVDHGTVYIGSQNGNVYAFDATDGHEVWQAATAAAVDSSPAVENGVVYVIAADGEIYAFNAADGTRPPRWHPRRFFGGIATDISPAVANGLVYVGSQGTLHAVVYALSALTGQVRWETDLGTDGDVVSTPVIADGTVYVAASSGRLDAVDASNGHLRWPVLPVVNGGVNSELAVANRRIWVTAPDGTLRRFLADYGTEEGDGLLLDPWSGGDASAPTVANGVVYLVRQTIYGDTLYAVGPNITVVSATPIPDTLPSASPVVANGYVYIGTADGNLRAYTLGTHGGGPPSD
jgi:uncharacterized repeat protein (TIGR01451 family)